MVLCTFRPLNAKVMCIETINLENYNVKSTLILSHSINLNVSLVYFQVNTIVVG